MIEFVLFFTAILIPNIFRQLCYLKAYKKSKSFGFCVSPETKGMHKRKWLPWSGILEELGWASIWSFFWYIIGWQWLAFGWISDALLDCAIAYSWTRKKRKPKILFAGARGAFFVREVLLPYLIIGPLLWFSGLNIYVYAVASSIIGLLILLKT